MNTPMENVDLLPADRSPNHPRTAKNIVGRRQSGRPLMISQTRPFYTLFSELFSLRFYLFRRPFLLEIWFKSEQRNTNVVLDDFKQIRNNLRLHKRLTHPEIANV